MWFLLIKGFWVGFLFVCFSLGEGGCSQIQLRLWNSCSSIERKYCLVFQNKSSSYFCAITNVAFGARSVAGLWSGRSGSPAAGAAQPGEPNGASASGTTQPAGSAGGVSTLPVRLFFRDIFIFKKSVTVSSYLNFGMKSLGCEIPASPRTLKSVSVGVSNRAGLRPRSDFLGFCHFWVAHPMCHHFGKTAVATCLFS